MLFILSESIQAEAQKAPMLSHVRLAISRLLSRFIDGHHVVVFNRATCLAIEASSEFSAREQSAARKIRNRYTEYGSIATRLKIYAEVVIDGDTPSRSNSRWIVPVRWLATHTVDKLQLIGEDLNDANALRMAAQDYLWSNKLGGLEVQLRAINGGGANTHKVLEDTVLVEEQIVLCVVDSDRCCPDAPIGATARRCLDFPGPGFFELRLTTGRSIENALPWKLLEAVKSPSAGDKLNTIERIGAGCTKFVDLKHGVSGRHVFAPNARKYWQRIATEAIGEPECCENPCEAQKEVSCRYQVLSGYGTSLLADVCAYLVCHESPSRYRLYLPSPNATEWLEAGRAVCEYALGVKPLRS